MFVGGQDGRPHRGLLLFYRSVHVRHRMASETAPVEGDGLEGAAPTNGGVAGAAGPVVPGGGGGEGREGEGTRGPDALSIAAFFAVLVYLVVVAVQASCTTIQHLSASDSNYNKATFVTNKKINNAGTTVISTVNY